MKAKMTGMHKQQQYWMSTTFVSRNGCDSWNVYDDDQWIYNIEDMGNEFVLTGTNTEFVTSIKTTDVDHAWKIVKSVLVGSDA